MSGLVKVNPVKSDNIPDFLKSLPHWVVWKSFNTRDDGRFAKIPIHPISGHKINGQDKRNQMDFNIALKLYEKGVGNGVGIVLNGQPLTMTNTCLSQYLIGVDLDKVTESSEKIDAAKNTCKSIGSYYEISPSGKGIRIFALSKNPLGRGQSVHGEMYYKGRFLTITGHGQKRDIVEATNALLKIEKEWWPNNKLKIKKKIQLPFYNYPDTPRRRAELDNMLSFISSDCSYERYRDVIWAILSTRLPDANLLAHKWCMTSPQRFDEINFSSVVNSFDEDHENLITIGSIYYWAREGGWNEQYK